jgi:hypothetical protein
MLSQVRFLEFFLQPLTEGSRQGLDERIEFKGQFDRILADQFDFQLRKQRYANRQ